MLFLQANLARMKFISSFFIEDRKTDLVFSVKDFLFSHEPSSWRFDVTEKLHGQPQVVDFTDDTFGAPHDIAKSHMSMYVNEVGHNMDLVENVEVRLWCTSLIDSDML